MSPRSGGRWCPASIMPPHLGTQKLLGRPEVVVEKAAVRLLECRLVLDDVKTVTAYTKDVSRFLMKSELTELRDSIDFFVREIVASPDNTVICFSPGA